MKNYYNENLETIKTVNKEFAKKLKDIKPCEEVEIIGDKNFLIVQGSKEILAYPKDKEFEVIDKSFDNFNLYNDEVSILVGIGNGYLLRKLLNKSEEKHLIFVVEPVLQLLKFALESYDFSKEIKEGKLILCISKDELPYLFGIIEASKVVQMWHTMIDNYTVLMQKQYSEITKSVMNNVNQMMCNVGTVMGAGKIIAENDIKNLPYVIKHRGVKDLKNLYKNKPAIVILSAPPVTKLIPELLQKDYRKKVVIIAIAQMLRPLLAFGIKPDFVCTLDYGEVNIEHFDNLWHIKDVPLVALNRTYAPILEKWAGYKFISTGLNPTHPDSIITMLNEKGQLDQGGSVGHMALGLAVHLGCNPVIHIGFDCAYDNDEGLSHNKLGDAVGKVKIKEDNTLEWEVDDPNSILKDKKHSMGNVVYLPGYFGGVVPTNPGLASFVTSMNRIFQAYPKTLFINSCEGGAKKEACIQMSLRKALKDYCKKRINKKKINKLLSLKPNWEKDVEEAKRRLRWEIDLFDQEISACTKALTPLKQMETEKDEKKLIKLMEANEKHSIVALNLAKSSNLLSLHIYKTNREIHRRDLQVKGSQEHLLQNKEDLQTRIKRSRMILEASKKSSKELKKIYQDVLEKLEQGIRYKEGITEIDSRTWDKLLENGNWARPLLESEYSLIRQTLLTEERDKTLRTYNLCLDLKQKSIREGLTRPDLTDVIEYQKIIEETKELGLKFQFQRIVFLLEKARKLNVPNKLDCLWGLATTYHYLGKIEKSLKEYEKLKKIYPENVRFQFEYGQVMLQKDIRKGIDIISEVIERANQFQDFYIRLAELEATQKRYDRAEHFLERYKQHFPHSKSAEELQEIIKEYK